MTGVESGCAWDLLHQHVMCCNSKRVHRDGCALHGAVLRLMCCDGASQ